MNGKLTRDMVKERLCNIGPMESTGTIIDWFMEHIEADREAIREEVLGKILKNHFCSGEIVEVNWKGNIGPRWQSGKVVIWLDDGAHLTDLSKYEIRRPRKMRPMTQDEKIDALKRDPVFGRFTFTHLFQLRDETINDLLNSIGVSNEVPE